MVLIEPNAVVFLRDLIQKQGERGLNLRLSVLRPGTAMAECDLTFCPPGQESMNDMPVLAEGFTLFLAADALPFLTGARIELQDQGVSASLNIVAPQLRPQTGGSIADQVQALLDSEINPALASHKGHCTLVEVTDTNEVWLRFGGGCHGCGMVDVTLKQGIEKTLKEKIPAIIAVKDATDHESGKDPYFK